MMLEDNYAKQIREYSKNIDVLDRIKIIEEYVNDFYKEINFNQKVKLTPPFVEVTHGAQFPFLGIIRMVLKAVELAEKTGGTMLYFISDNYTANMWPTTTLLSFNFEGLPPQKQKTPINFGVGKKNRNIPLKLLPPPTKNQIQKMKKLVLERLPANINYIQSLGIKTKNIEEAPKKIEKVFDLLEKTSSQVKNYADWTTLLQALTLKEMLQEKMKNLAIIPLWNISNVFKDDFIEILNRTEVLDEKNHIPFWIICNRCKRKIRGVLKNNNIEIKCKDCGIKEIVHKNGFFEKNTVTPQFLALQLANSNIVSGRVIGSIQPYLKPVDELTKKIYNRPAPPRFLLNSIPRFIGLGEPKEGDPKTSLIRAACEVDYERLYRELSVSWKENPVIKSDFLD